MPIILKYLKAKIFFMKKNYAEGSEGEFLFRKIGKSRPQTWGQVGPGPPGPPDPLVCSGFCIKIVGTSCAQLIKVQPFNLYWHPESEVELI